MKHHILIIPLVIIMATPKAQALFGHATAEKERRLETEQELVEQRDATDKWHNVAAVLGAGAVAAFIIGAGVGSAGRRASHAKASR